MSEIIQRQIQADTVRRTNDGVSIIRQGENTAAAALARARAEAAQAAAEAQALIALAAASTAEITQTLTFTAGLANYEYQVLLAAPWAGNVVRVAAQVHDVADTSFDLQLFINDAPIGSPVTIGSTLYFADISEAFPDGGTVTAQVTNSDATAATIEVTYSQDPPGAIPGLSGLLTASDFTASGPCMIGRSAAGAGALAELPLVKVWEVIETIATTSGSSVLFDNIPAGYTELQFEWQDVSHDNGASQNWNIEVSRNNGSTWSNAQSLLSFTLAGSTFVNGIVTIRNADRTRLGWESNLGGTTADPGLASVGLRGGAVRLAAGRVDAIRFTLTAGAHDAGAIVLRGR
jgi:hypothetical protein